MIIVFYLIVIILDQAQWRSAIVPEVKNGVIEFQQLL